MITHKLPCKWPGHAGEEIEEGFVWFQKPYPIMSVPQGWVATIEILSKTKRHKREKIDVYLFPFDGSPHVIMDKAYFHELSSHKGKEQVFYIKLFSRTDSLTRFYAQDGSLSRNAKEAWTFENQDKFSLVTFTNQKEIPSSTEGNITHRLSSRIDTLEKLLMNTHGLEDEGIIIFGKGKTSAFSFNDLLHAQISHDGKTIAVLTKTEFIILDNPLI